MQKEDPIPKYWINPMTPIPCFLNACYRKLKQKLKISLNFVILSISKSCLPLPDKMLELFIQHKNAVWSPTWAGRCPVPTLWTDTRHPSTAPDWVTANLHHTEQPSRVRGHYQASGEWLIHAQLISRVGVPKLFPRLDSKRQPQTNLTVREETTPSCLRWWKKHLAECCLKDCRRDQKPQQEID